MRKTLLLVSLFLIQYVLVGCSYYGENTYLEAVGEKTISCLEVKATIDPMLIDFDKKASAFAGVPLFPSSSKRNPSAEFNTLYVWYENIGEKEVCSLDDIDLEEVGNGKHFFPKEIWQSKIVEKDGIRCVGCMYTFDEIDKDIDYNLIFKEEMFDCNLPIVPLTQRVHSGYHRVLVQ